MSTYLCPFCIDENECGYPHIPEEHLEAFNEHVNWYFRTGLRQGWESAKRSVEKALERKFI